MPALACHLSFDMTHDDIGGAFVGEGVIHLRHGNGSMAGDKLHSVGFTQVLVWSDLDTDVENVDKAELLSPHPSQELVISCFDGKKDDCSDHASGSGRRRPHPDFVEGSRRRTARKREEGSARQSKRGGQSLEYLRSAWSRGWTLLGFAIAPSFANEAGLDSGS